MRTDSRLLLVLAAALLVPVFFLPLWSVGLVAPQYREGLGMYIGLSDIWGHTQHDIQNINILNHYIGMRPVVPEEVNLLAIMPWVVGAIIAAALLVALVGRRYLLVAWLVLFAVAGAAGMYELYSWKYEYGHNLNPDAPIKVPGMTYMPPIIGTKQLLNITASSYPSWGTLFLGLAFLAGLLALVNEYRPLRRWFRRARGGGPATADGTRGALKAAAAAGLVLLGAACGQTEAGPAGGATEAVFAPGSACDYCDGEIPEARFGGELVTRDGAIYRFMSVECLAGFVLEQRVPAAQIASLRVVDYNHGKKLIDAATAKYVRTPNQPSPNGLNLLAVETERVAWNLHFFFHGDRLDWDGVLDTVRKEWSL